MTTLGIVSHELVNILILNTCHDNNIFSCVSSSMDANFTDRQTDSHLALLTLVWFWLAFYDYVWYCMVHVSTLTHYLHDIWQKWNNICTILTEYLPIFELYLVMFKLNWYKFGCIITPKIFAQYFAIFKQYLYYICTIFVQ